MYTVYPAIREMFYEYFSINDIIELIIRICPIYVAELLRLTHIITSFITTGTFKLYTALSLRDNLQLSMATRHLVA